MRSIKLNQIKMSQPNKKTELHDSVHLYCETLAWFVHEMIEEPKKRNGHWNLFIKWVEENQD